ncbi:MAG: amidohydrolase family protein [Bdellovibrio sp.]|nr:amidohydrolase family protein [Methylotenera sp.]
MNRRQFLLGASALTASSIAIASSKFWPETGFNNPCLSGLPSDLSNHPLMRQIWAGIDVAQVWDCHVHLVGTGDNKQHDKALSPWFNPNMDSIWHPILKTQKHFYMNGGCVINGDIDNSYVARLAQITSEMPIGFKSMLFAFDWFRDAKGRAVKEHSIFYIANEYAAKIASEHSQLFKWVCSIHPYRPDAVDALEAAKAQGARAIKWLPSGMGIDPANPKCDAFYKKAAALNIPIISHTGAESAVQGGEQAHGNPLRMRRALDNGERVVLAHCASEGYDLDTDNGNKRVKSIDLFTRIMESPDYKTLAFGEISALKLINHAAAIKPILLRTDWHERLLNGSDYPLPGIFPLINTTQLAKMDLLKLEYMPFLQQVKAYNPLMFDFAVKRLIEVDGVIFAKSIFETRKFFDNAI